MVAVAIIAEVADIGLRETRSFLIHLGLHFGELGHFAGQVGFCLEDGTISAFEFGFEFLSGIIIGSCDLVHVFDFTRTIVRFHFVK